MDLSEVLHVADQLAPGTAFLLERFLDEEHELGHSSLAYSYVRFSSKPQERGDSLRRQITLAQKYAEQHGLQLDTRTYQDLGISAFKGKNALEGKLGAFLKAVDAGLIPKGATLLVENLDRISRQQVDEALELFLSILRRGIRIVTLQDGQVYSSERIKEDKGISLIGSIMWMMRAHEESATKATRIRSAWDAKSKRGEILTAMCPSWLELSADRTSFVQIPEKVEVVRKIFAMAASGLGSVVIAKQLQQQNVPTMATARWWEPGVVMALLKNRAVIGELSRKKAGADPIEKYYPAIVDADVFHAVQEHIAKRRGTGGRKGENVANLFTGLLRCLCGERMRYVGGKYSHRYLRCVRSYSNQGCSAPQVPYNLLEEEVLELLLTWGSMSISDRPVIDPTVALRGELEAKQKRLQNVLTVIEAADAIAAPKTLLAQVQRLETEIEGLEHALRNVVVPAPVSEVLAETVELWNEHRRLKEQGGAELEDLRLRLQAECKRLLSKIAVNDEIDSDTFNGHPVEHLRCVLYGPVIEANAHDVDRRWFTEDGGWELSMLLPPFGINGTRRRKRQA